MSDICHVFTREVTAPLTIGLTVEITDCGIIEHIDGEADDAMADADFLRIQRAVTFVASLIQLTQKQGHLLADVTTGLPADFDVEQSILSVLSELQTGVIEACLPSYAGSKRKPGSLN